MRKDTDVIVIQYGKSERLSITSPLDSVITVWHERLMTAKSAHLLKNRPINKTPPVPAMSECMAQHDVGEIDAESKTPELPQKPTIMGTQSSVNTHFESPRFIEASDSDNEEDRFDDVYSENDRVSSSIFSCFGIDTSAWNNGNALLEARQPSTQRSESISVETKSGVNANGVKVSFRVKQSVIKEVEEGEEVGSMSAYFFGSLNPLMGYE
mmetsp:Transcript_54611/g.70205  ORF Transcript_54611/g.70205 Transcript_54611/m.70205 type:complete len:211 (+) Transcript_54611:3-635(+)